MPLMIACISKPCLFPFMARLIKYYEECFMDKMDSVNTLGILADALGVCPHLFLLVLALPEVKVVFLF